VADSVNAFTGDRVLPAFAPSAAAPALGNPAEGPLLLLALLPLPLALALLVLLLLLAPAVPYREDVDVSGRDAEVEERAPPAPAGNDEGKGAELDRGKDEEGRGAESPLAP